MKKRIISLVMAMTILVISLSGCSNKKEAVVQPDIMKVRSICELATLECYYHNVAKSIKHPESGITHIGEKDREFWIEYDGVVKLGVELSKVKMSIDGENITITIPEATIMSVDVDRKSYNSESFIMAKDGWNSTKITAEDATAAVENARAEMEKTARNNSSLLVSAQNRAKNLIENYILKIGEATNTTYYITWEYLDNNSNAASGSENDSAN